MTMLGLYFTIMNSPYDRVVDKAINELMKRDDLSVVIDRCHINIYKRDRRVAYLGNGNKWYAWLDCGKIGEYEWDRARPSRRTMLKFERWLVKKNVLSF